MSWPLLIRCDRTISTISTTATATMMAVFRLAWSHRDRPAPDPCGPQAVIARPGSAGSGPVDVVDAEPGGRHGLEAGRIDGHPAGLAVAVVARIQPGDGC